MSWLHSFAQRHTPSLLTGLLLYWEAVTYACCEVATSFGALSGSSLYDPASSSSIAMSVPNFGDAGSPQQPSEDYREWRDRKGL